MSEQTDKTQLVMTPKAAEAFAEWVALGPGANYAQLVDHFTKRHARSQTVPPTTSEGTVRQWASRYDWRGRRLALAVEMAEEAEELRALCLLLSLRQLHDRLKIGAGVHIETLLKAVATMKSHASDVRQINVIGKVAHDHSGVVKVAHHDLSGLTPEQVDAIIALQRSRLPETSEVGS